jgi:toxin ParE1/3/4
VKRTQVIWTDESISDLEAIFEFIALTSPESAELTALNILNRTGQLETFPQTGTPFKPTTTNNREYRYLIESHYKIIYSLDNDSLFIETVIDTRQNPDKTRIMK